MLDCTLQPYWLIGETGESLICQTASFPTLSRTKYRATKGHFICTRKHKFKGQFLYRTKYITKVQFKEAAPFCYFTSPNATLSQQSR